MKKIFTFLGVLLLISIQFMFVGCGSTEYFFNEPKSNDVSITGVDKSDEILEISDSYKENYTDGKDFWIVINRGSQTYLGKIDFTSGTVSNLTVLNDYDIDKKSIYWSLYDEDYHGVGQKILNFLSPDNSRKWYVFSGGKNVWGDSKKQIFYGYAWNDNSKVVSENVKFKTISNSEDRIIYTTFQNEDQTIFITKTYGYSYFIDDGNHTGKKCRIYKVNNNTFIGMQPSDLTACDAICFFTYELNNQTGFGTSYGAKVKDLDGYYIDAAIDKEGKQIGVIYMRAGKYTLKKYDAMEFAKSIKKLASN
jgi:hypothetical protein